MKKKIAISKINKPTPAGVLETFLTMLNDDTLLDAEETFRHCIKSDRKGWNKQDRELIAEAFDNQAQYRGEAWRR